MEQFQNNTKQKVANKPYGINHKFNRSQRRTGDIPQSLNLLSNDMNFIYGRGDLLCFCHVVRMNEMKAFQGSSTSLWILSSCSKKICFGAQSSISFIYHRKHDINQGEIIDKIKYEGYGVQSLFCNLYQDQLRCQISHKPYLVSRILPE